MEKIRELYESLQLRKRPEDIADLILEVLKSDLSISERKTLEFAAKGSLKRRFLGYSSMAQEFAEAIGAEKQIKKTIELFELHEMDNVDPNHVPDIEGFIKEVSPLIHKEVGQNNFLAERLNKTERAGKGLDLSKRAYNKRWRLLSRLEKKLLTLQRELQKREFQMIAKHGIVHRLSYEAFAKDRNTACFIAYYNARCNMRSVFTNGSQARAYDKISDLLFRRCRGEWEVSRGWFDRRVVETENTANWWAIAHIYTGQDVLEHLTEEEKGRLLGSWTEILQDIAFLLEEVWENSAIDRQTMIVRRGNDSTTWNNTAGAWNKARDQWMNIIYALGMDYALDDLCFGKVMRLMAADVAAWHRSTGGRLDANTEVWNRLPLPWEVFRGVRECNKQQVVRCCEAVGIHPERSGWIAPRAHGVEEFRPTPELVHGVEVANPFLASVLKKHKYFSGKHAKALHPEDN